MDLEALIRVAEALDAGVQRALAPAVKEIQHIQGTLELLYQVALDLDLEIARLIILWTGLEIPPEGKEEQAVPHEREPQPLLPTLQAISPFIPVTISLASLLERESTIREVLTLQKITGAAPLPFIPRPDRGVLPYSEPRFATPLEAPSRLPPVSGLPAAPPQILSASLLLNALYSGFKAGERGEGEAGLAGYPMPERRPVPPIQEVGVLQDRIIQSLPEAVTGLSQDITERVSLHYPDTGKEFPEYGAPPYPPTDLPGVLRMVNSSQRIIREMVNAGEVRPPGPPDHGKMMAPSHQVAGAIALQRQFLRTVTERTMEMPRVFIPEALSPQFPSMVPGHPMEVSPAGPGLQALQRDLLQSSPVAAQIALFHQITSLVHESAGAFQGEARIIPALTPMLPGQERGAEAPIPSPPVSRPAALRPIIEIPHFAPLLRQSVPGATGPGISPPSRGAPSIEPHAWPVPQHPADSGLMHALGGLAASRSMVSGFMDHLSPFIRSDGGAAAAGIPLAVPGAFQAPYEAGAGAGLPAAWPWMDWISPVAVAETVAASFPFGFISRAGGGEAGATFPFGVISPGGGGEAGATFPVPWPMAREILPGLPFERMVSLMPANAGTMKAISSVLEPLALTIPPMGGGGPFIPPSFQAPVAPLGQNISLAFGGASPPPPAKNEISIANTFQIDVSVKGHDTDRELRELGEKIGTILSEELKRYGGTLWR